MAVTSMMTKIFVGAIGIAILTLLMAIQETLYEPKWQGYKPGRLFGRAIAGLFVLWIIWAIDKMR